MHKQEACKIFATFRALYLHTILSASTVSLHLITGQDQLLLFNYLYMSSVLSKST